MALIGPEYIEQFRKLASDWLAERNLNCDMVKSGSDAWAVAHRAGITDICYGNTAKDLPGIDGCVDAHIKTALQKIFPNAVFSDKYQY